MITRTLISLAGLGAPFFVDFSDFPWIRFWEYPVIVALVFIILISRSTFTGEANPFIRQAATGAYTDCITLTVLVVAGVLWGRLASNETIRWSMMIASFLYLLATMMEFIKGLPTRMREFLVIKKRHDDLVESHSRLEQFAFLTGDVQDWRDANDAIVESQSLAQKAEGLLNQGKLDEASGYLLRAETNIAYFENLITTRFSVTLSETLSVKLGQAKSDLEKLTEQARQSVLDENPFTELWKEHARLAPIAETLTTQDEKFSERIGEFETFFRRITQIRTALRFRQNVASRLDDLDRELEPESSAIELATRLEIHGSDVKDTHKTLYEAMNLIRSRELSSIDEFVSAYQRMQQARGRLQSLLAAVRQTVDLNWTSAKPIGEAVTIRVPKLSHTDKPDNAVVTVEPSNGGDRPAELTMRGTGIKVPDRLTLPESGPGKPTVRSFSIMGERGGHGRVEIDIRSSTGKLLGEHRFPIDVLRSFRETIGTAAQFGTVGGAAAGLILWYFGYKLEIAGPVGIMLAVIVGMMRFGWTRVQIFRR
jgi:hypothetical protein